MTKLNSDNGFRHIDSMRLQDKVTIITGAGSGIGQATAIKFSEEGANVVVADMIDTAGNETVKQIRSVGGEAVFLHTDVTSANEIQTLITSTIEIYGKLDVLFNNAGIPMRFAAVDLPEEDWDRCIDINLKAAYLGSKYAIPEMIKNGVGSIINTASIYGLVGGSNRVAYAASKGGIVNLTRAMALDHANDNIRVNCICPGFTNTPLIKKITETRAKYQELVSHHPMGRIARPLDIAYGALYLASDESEFVTGIALPIDGGYLAG